MSWFWMQIWAIGHQYHDTQGRGIDIDAEIDR